MVENKIPYRIEPELSAARPRRVRFTTETQKRRFRAYCAAFIPFAVVLGYGLRSVDYEEALLTKGQIVNARILSTAYVDDGHSTKDGLSAEHISAKQARDFPDGSKLTILCLPNSRKPGVPYVMVTEAEILKRC